MGFIDSLDVGNRACQLLGVNSILSITEDTPNNNEISNAYDKVRRAELRRNTWRFATRKAVLRAIDTTTLQLVPELYDSTKTYLPGEMVKDSNGLMWLSLAPDNLGNSPGGNNEAWDAYFGPMTAGLYDSTVSYQAGELVYVVDVTKENGYQVYLSLISANTDVPGTATAWSSTTQYKQDDVVSYLASQWRSLLPVNLNNTPTAGPAAWVSTTTYSSGNQVTGSNAHVYTSATNGNVGNDPTTDDGTNWTDAGTVTAWTSTPTLIASSINWRPLNATLKNITTIYPLGAGPSTQTSTRNVFRLPAGYLMTAPAAPKSGSTGLLGGATGNTYNDWVYEGDYIVSSETGPLLLRFVADVTLVRTMDDMFCEGLACRIATATCARLTQSEAKLTSLASQYRLFMGEARLRNAIEIGEVFPPDDEFITVRY